MFKSLIFSNLKWSNFYKIMLQSKDIQSIEELKKYFSSSTKMVDYLVNLLSFFEFKRVYGVLKPLKKRGYDIINVFPIFIILPFLKHASIYAPMMKWLKEAKSSCIWYVGYIKVNFLSEPSKNVMSFFYLSLANQKRKQAMLRSNLPAIWFADVDKSPL